VRTLRVSKDLVISIDYIIQLADGTLVESSTGDSALTYLHGHAQIVAGVERAIEGAHIGEVRQVTVQPSEGFGERNPEGVFMVPRSAFPPQEDEIAPGMTFSATRTDGRTLLFRVVEAKEDEIVVDANHPLAGQVLLVWVAVRSIREATFEELTRGRAILSGTASVPVA
jgi:FKBP-type peptidyl-prolyl cis-trans isomerase SlyD